MRQSELQIDDILQLVGGDQIDFTKEMWGTVALDRDIKDTTYKGVGVYRVIRNNKCVWQAPGAIPMPVEG